MKVFAAALRPFLLTLVCAALFAGCCGSNSCECANYRVDALQFQFSADTVSPNPAGFRAAQLDTILIVRSAWPRPDTVTTGNTIAKNKADTARIVRPRSTVFNAPIVIDNAEPFAAVNGRKLGSATNPDSSYRYTIIIPASRRGQPPVQRYYIGRVRLQGALEGDGCCTCYRNKRKEFTLKNLNAPGAVSQWIDVTTAPGAPAIVTELRR